MDKYRLDGHKLNYHIGRLNDWLQGRVVYPIFAEISPSGTCNHRCSFCAVDYLKYNKGFLEKELLKGTLSEMARFGLKSVLYSGEGEPLLHESLGEIIIHTKSQNIDVALVSNGVYLTNDFLHKTLGSLCWVKISLDSATPETHAKIHRSHPKDFDRIITNIAHAVRLKKEKNYSCTIGIQLLLLPDNAHEVEILAKKSKEIGVDYLVVKPYSQHPLSHNIKYSTVHYDNHNHLKELPHQFNNGSFSLIIRQHTMDKYGRDRSYKRCYGIPFMTYIDTEGNVWACKDYIGDPRFNLGNIARRRISEIFNSPETQKFYRWASEELDVSQCRSNCRLDEVNRFLWELKNLPAHVNFI